jgi:hypothetical protein
MLLHLKRYSKEVQPESFSVQEIGTWEFKTDSGIKITHKLDPVQTYFETQIWG